MLAIQRYSTCPPFVQEYCIIYNSTTKCESRHGVTVSLPLKPKGFHSCLVAFWSSWRDCCLIFSFSRCAPFWRKNREVYPFWRSPFKLFVESPCELVVKRECIFLHQLQHGPYNIVTFLMKVDDTLTVYSIIINLINYVLNVLVLIFV